MGWKPSRKKPGEIKTVYILSSPSGFLSGPPLGRTQQKPRQETSFLDIVHMGQLPHPKSEVKREGDEFGVANGRCFLMGQPTLPLSDRRGRVGEKSLLVGARNEKKHSCPSIPLCFMRFF